MPVKNQLTQTAFPVRGTVKTEKETVLLAQRFGRLLRGGELVFLRGPLGSGKTTFARALAGSLGVTSAVRSPTFVLLKRYKIRVGKIRWLIHVDAYRVRSWRECEAIGLFDHLGQPNTVTLIEWPPRGTPPISGPVISVSFKPKGLMGRAYSITAHNFRLSR